MDGVADCPGLDHGAGSRLGTRGWRGPGMCQLCEGDVSSFWPDVSTFWRNVSSFGGNVSTLAGEVSVEEGGTEGQVRSDGCVDGVAGCAGIDHGAGSPPRIGVPRIVSGAGWGRLFAGMTGVVARMGAVSTGRPRCVQRGRLKAGRRDCRSQRRGAHVRELGPETEQTASSRGMR